MSYELASVILPIYAQRTFVARVVRGYEEHLAKLPVPFEVLLVVNGPKDGTLEECQLLEREFTNLRVIESEAGWGLAVQQGLKSAEGDLLCYTNSARTSPEVLALSLFYATAYEGVAIKASRRTRDSFLRRLGSLMYNLECRWLFDVATFDVNGTPKVFPRAFERLLVLSRSDDLIDAEWNAACRRYGYPVLEVPIVSSERHGGRSTTNVTSALRMYRGALELARASK